MQIVKSIIFYIIELIVIVIPFILVAVIWAFTAPFDPKRRVINYLTVIWSRLFFFCAPSWRVTIEGLENIDRQSSYVIVANHQAMLDIPLLRWLPMNLKWVSKKEIMNMPVFGLIMKFHKDISFDREAVGGAKLMITSCLACLKDGISVVIFPEGTRSKSGRMGRFKDGSFDVAKRATSAILPIVTDGTHDAIGVKGWQIKTPKHFVIRVLAPISAETVAVTDVKELNEMCHQQMVAEHKSMRPELYT